VELGEEKDHCPEICPALTAVRLKFCLIFVSSLTNEVIRAVDIIARDNISQSYVYINLSQHGGNDTYRLL